MTTGPALYMVCYKTNPDSYLTYWDVIAANSPEEATAQADRNGLFQHGRRHVHTCGYNRAGMTVEQTYAAYLEEQKAVA